MKKCTKCQETKNETDFYTSKHHKDGLQNYCKLCKRIGWNLKNSVSVMKARKSRLMEVNKNQTLAAIECQLIDIVFAKHPVTKRDSLLDELLKMLGSITEAQGFNPNIDRLKNKVFESMGL